MPRLLTNLPPELVRCVVANIESKSTLCNLVRCSRQLYRSATPSLYRHVTIRQVIWQGKWRNDPLRDLASLLLQRPDLAGLVRNFTLNVEPPRRRAEPLDLEELERREPVEVDQALRTAVHALSLYREEEELWLRRLSDPCRCYPELVLALLLSALLKLKVLRLNTKIPAGFDTRFLGRLMGRAACGTSPIDVQQPFEALKVFTLHGRRKKPSTVGFLASLLKLPAIRKIEFHGHLDARGDDLGTLGVSRMTLELLDSAFSPLTRLVLAARGVSTADLGHILRAPKSLKTLYYVFCPHSCQNFIDIRSALAPQEKCLEILSFDYDDYYEKKFDLTPRICFKPLPSFLGFNALKYFKIAAPFLEKTTEDGNSLENIYPPSLETLHITRVQSCLGNILVEALLHLVAHKSPQQIPSLKRIILEETALSLRDELAIFGRLDRVAATQGVDFIAYDCKIGIEWI
ncbi:hypothetical protein MMC07_005624 [Pseudocyphellaria aurata]|nr:hypothetical protein [Pseudocyphellaria aurata]